MTGAIRSGDVATLSRLPEEDPTLATERIVGNGSRTPPPRRTDWPGHFPDVARTIDVLVAAGAEVDAPFLGTHPETALHWAASTDDLAALDRLIDGGAGLEAPGSVIDGGSPLSDAVAFGRWQAAALGLSARVEALLAASPPPAADADERALVRVSRRAAGDGRVPSGARRDPTWVGHDGLTPAQAARREGADALADWLEGRVAR